MAWIIKFDKKAQKQLLGLDGCVQKQIDKFFLKIVKSENPLIFAERLKGNLKGLWRYRVGDYRILFEIENQMITIFIVSIEHRKEVYRY